MKHASQILTILGVICLVPLLTPMHSTIPYEEKSDGKITHGTDERFTLGIPQSPWFIHSSVSRKTEIKSEKESSSSMSFTHSTKVEFISWSFELFVVGVILLVLGKRLGKRYEKPTSIPKAEIEKSL